MKDFFTILYFMLTIYFTNGQVSKINQDKSSELEPAGTRIIGGSSAAECQFPYQALLSYSNEPYCGASIIHKRWILTARHCILENETHLASITVGTNRLDGKGGKSVSVDTFIPHPDYSYDPNVKGIEYVINDIGLVRLSEDLKFSDKVKAVKLATPELLDLTDDIGYISGWGATKDEKKSPLLQYTSVRVLDRFVCRQFWPYVRSSHLCTSVVNYKSVCTGDSGGALVINGRQYGVVSTAEENCEFGGKPNLYADVSAYVWWIKAEVERWGDNVDF